jgi:hypothetical protein
VSQNEKSDQMHECPYCGPACLIPALQPATMKTHLVPIMSDDGESAAMTWVVELADHQMARAALETRLRAAKDLLDSCAQGIVPDSRIRAWEAEVGEVKEEV